MKTRTLLPVSVLVTPSAASVERILASSFWGDAREETGEAQVVHLDWLRARREASAEHLMCPNPAANADRLQETRQPHGHPQELPYVRRFRARGDPPQLQGGVLDG